MSGLCHGVPQSSGVTTVTAASADNAVQGVLNPDPFSQLCLTQRMIYRLIRDKNGCLCS